MCYGKCRWTQTAERTEAQSCNEGNLFTVKGEFSGTVYLQQNVNGNAEPGRAGEETHTGSTLDLVLFAKTSRRKRTRRGDPKKQRGEILRRKQNPVQSPAKIIHRLQE